MSLTFLLNQMFDNLNPSQCGLHKTFNIKIIF
jgi:hypothetical protein